MHYQVRFINHHTGETGTFNQVMAQEQRDLQVIYGHISDQDLINRWNSQPISQITGLQWIYTLLP